MINSTSARILEVLRNVPSVLFIKITLFERQRVCDFYECIYSLVLPDDEAVEKSYIFN